MLSCQVFLQVVDLLHLLEQLLLAVFLAFQPLSPQDLATRDRLTERHRVDEAVLESAGTHAHTGKVVCVIFLAEISELVGNVKVLQLISAWIEVYWVYFLERR